MLGFGWVGGGVGRERRTEGDKLTIHNIQKLCRSHPYAHLSTGVHVYIILCGAIQYLFIGGRGGGGGHYCNSDDH